MILKRICKLSVLLVRLYFAKRTMNKYRTCNFKLGKQLWCTRKPNHKGECK